MDDILKVIPPIVTAIVAAISTVIVTKMKSKKTSSLVSTTDENDLRVIHSNRVDLTSKDTANGRVYRTRRYDRVRSPISGMVTVDNDTLTITGKKHIITVSGVTAIVSNGVIVLPTEDIAIVSKMESGEGRLFVSISEVAETHINN